VKVDDLEGIELDFYVAKAEGFHLKERDDSVSLLGPPQDGSQENFFCVRFKNPDGTLERSIIGWSFIGPIIERDQINFSSHEETRTGDILWMSETYDLILLDLNLPPVGGQPMSGLDVLIMYKSKKCDQPYRREGWDTMAYGISALEAIKRCIVKRKYGETVDLKERPDIKVPGPK